MNGTAVTAVLLKAISRLKGLLYPNEADFGSDEFIENRNRINVTRAKWTSFAFVCMEVAVLAVSLSFKKERMIRPPGSYYLTLYFVLLLAMLAFSLLFRRLEKSVQAHKTVIGVVGVVFSTFILCWCAGISVLDQMSSGQISVYIFAVLAIAVTPYFKPGVLLLMYLPVHTVFLVLLAEVSAPTRPPFANCVNSTAFLMVAWMISTMRYQRLAEEFKNRKLIEQKNSELVRVNLELQKANKKLRTLSRVDGLTGIFNRAMFDIAIRSEWDRCKRHLMPMTLLMIDVDFFKGYNDHYGHRAGDECIRKVAKVIASCARRDTDIVARYGGDEFAVILPYTEQEKAQLLAERIREGIGAREISYEFSGVSRFVTVSIGLFTGVPADDLSAGKFIEHADQALYDAKKHHDRIAAYH